MLLNKKQNLLLFANICKMIENLSNICIFFGASFLRLDEVYGCSIYYVLYN